MLIQNRQILQENIHILDQKLHKFFLMNSAKKSNVGSEIVHFNHDGQGIIAGNKSHLKVDKISYTKNYVAESSRGGAYKVTIHG